MKAINKSIGILICALFAIACDRQIPIPKIYNLSVFRDTVHKYEIRLPDKWIRVFHAGKLLCYSSNEVIRRFDLYDQEGYPGARIEACIKPADANFDADNYIAELKVKFSGGVKFVESEDYLNDIKYKKVIYTFDRNDGKFLGETIFIPRNSNEILVVTFEAFGKACWEYKTAFNIIENTIKLNI